MTEAQHQKLIFQWALAIRSKYPDLKLLHHIPNGGKRDKIEAVNLKAQGVKRGVPDLHLPVSRHGFHSLYIELKTETGKTSPEQDWWINGLEAVGNCARVCHGYEEAIRLIEWYLGGKDDTAHKNKPSS